MYFVICGCSGTRPGTHKHTHPQPRPSNTTILLPQVRLLPTQWEVSTCSIPRVRRHNHYLTPTSTPVLSLLATHVPRHTRPACRLTVQAQRVSTPLPTSDQTSPPLCVYNGCASCLYSSHADDTYNAGLGLAMHTFPHATAPCDTLLSREVRTPCTCVQCVSHAGLCGSLGAVSCQTSSSQHNSQQY